VPEVEFLGGFAPMNVDAAQLIQFLLGRGLLDHAAIVSGDVMLVSERSRNLVSAVIRNEGPSYFIKQIQSWQPKAAESLRNEAHCYSLLAADDALRELRKVVPQFFCYDEATNTLVVELFKNAENLSMHHRRHQPCPPDIGRAFGQALGFYHKHGTAPESVQHSSPPPWVRLFQYFQSDQPFLSQANKQLLEIIRTSDLCGAMEALTGLWRDELLIHGDLKWDNCLLETDLDERRVRIVDWESSCLGDPLWDTASFLQCYVLAWVLSIPIKDGEADENRATFPLSSAKPAMHAFWIAYVAARDIEGANNQENLRRKCVQFIAARLVITIFEMHVFAHSLNPTSFLVLQLVSNLLKDPDRAYEFFHD